MIMIIITTGMLDDSKWHMSAVQRTMTTARRREDNGDTGTGASTGTKATSVQPQLQGSTTMMRLGLRLLHAAAALVLRNGTCHNPKSHYKLELVPGF